MVEGYKEPPVYRSVLSKHHLSDHHHHHHHPSHSKRKSNSELRLYHQLLNHDNNAVLYDPILGPCHSDCFRCRYIFSNPSS
ncbi:hypothetical protein K435DRAFT_507977 [Dendrothele bispora CBS 962.96]|uniref:Uncharacterized protein n=1 Tax=Dendrothele bispora (strain CBS 962.96) TaxID=1314807 RepID=A0A4S8MT99_DENBC|nr:hypothetical protein K435DRAFT_507977 [Dendrothele bispora CBS 962.96]